MFVIGAGMSGQAAAKLATDLGYDVTGYDRDSRTAHYMRSSGYVWADTWERSLISDVDLVVTSPGVPPSAPSIVDTLDAGLTLWSELEFAARHVTAPIAAVTGTNGKTSTVSAASMMLEASGIRVCAAGNIGTALSEVALGSWDAIVVEASSFQLQFTEAFHPSGAAILNVARDHLDWHGSDKAYAAAKARITANQRESDLLVYGADDAGAAGVAAASCATLLAVSGRRIPENGAGVSAKKLRLGYSIFTAPDLSADFLEDLVAAAAIARHMGATEEGIRIGLESFQPGAHRRATVGSWDGVSWVNDSKATNPHAALSAASAYSSVVLLAGGKSKGIDLTPMGSMNTVRRVVAMGESTEEIAEVFGRETVIQVSSMDEAVQLADEIARPGDTILLAPGCASFDMFASYGDRGEAFTEAVLARKCGFHGQ